jgi:hypothetical protein
MRHHRSLLSILASAAIASSLVSLPARADEPANKAQARALFESAMSQIAQGRFSDAICAQLGESQRLDPALGTHYQWARCLENTGKLASAWAMYLDVAEVAGSQKLPEQQRYARERADALKPKLTKLIITVPVELQQQTAGLEVRRDGVLLTATQYGLALPVDGGRHEISVVATGRRKWTTTVEAPTGTEGATITVSVPALQEDAELTAVPGITGAGGTPETRWTGQHTAGLALMGLGVAGLGVMAGFGLDTGSKHQAAKPHCTADMMQCNQQGIDLERAAHSSATIANVSLAVGGSLLAAGGLVFFLAPSLSAQRPPGAPQGGRPVVGVMVSPDGMRLTFGGDL